MWAENQGHSIPNARAVADGMTAADAKISEMGLGKTEATSMMKAEIQRIGQEIFGSK